VHEGEVSLLTHRFVVVQLSGNLGNQMFQYATGRATALRTHQDLYLFTSQGATFQLTPFRLGRWRVLTPAMSLRAALPPWTSRRGTRLLRPLAARLGVSHLSPPAFGIFDDRVLSVRGGVVLTGHWQSELYFADARATIEKEFELAREPRDIVIEHSRRWAGSCTVAVSVRRGDYLTAMPPDDLPTRAYYDSAMEILTNALGTSPQVIGFSDDRTWLSDEFTTWFPDAIIASGNITRDPYEELLAQSSCQHQIIAPSSFSWWAAWLNRNPEKLVVAPRRWVYDWAATDLVPETWLRT
jgi:hypothetical protein